MDLINHGEMDFIDYYKILGGDNGRLISAAEARTQAYCDNPLGSLLRQTDVALPEGSGTGGGGLWKIRRRCQSLPELSVGELEPIRELEITKSDLQRDDFDPVGDGEFLW